MSEEEGAVVNSDSVELTSFDQIFWADRALDALAARDALFVTRGLISDAEFLANEKMRRIERAWLRVQSASLLKASREG